MVTVRALQDRADCERVVELTASAFPEEVRGSGLTASWRDLELEDLLRQQWCWPSIGVACGEDGSLLGAIVLALPGDPDTGITYSDVRQRVGCFSTIWNWAYDQVLEAELKDYECLVEFIAVSFHARGKGVGSALLRWAETFATRALLMRWPSTVSARGSIRMTLWVAEDNADALRLYARQGYAVQARTDCGACACLQARLLNSFLGHPVWVHMAKPVMVPASLLPAFQAPPGLHASRVGQEEGGLVVVPLEDSRWQDGGSLPAPLRDGALRLQPQEIALVPQTKYSNLAGIGLLANARATAQAPNFFVAASPSAAATMPKAVWRGSSEDPATPLVLYAVHEPRERSTSCEGSTGRAHAFLDAGPSSTAGGAAVPVAEEETVVPDAQQQMDLAESDPSKVSHRSAQEMSHMQE